MIDLNKLNERSPSDNPLLRDFKLPGETFKLPSRCVTYDNTIVTDRVLETHEVHVHPMSAMDEIEMKSVDRILNGDVIVNVFKRTIPDIIDPTKLLAIDVEFLLVALRLVTYGPEMEIEVKHTCKDAKFEEFTINIVPFIRNTKPIDPTTTGEWTTKLSTGHTVKFKPADYFDIVQVLQIQSDNSASPKEKTIAAFIAIATCIDNINGVTDKIEIIQFLQNLPVTVIRDEISPMLRKVDQYAVFHTTKLKCGVCGEEYDFEVSIDPVHFF